MKKITIFYFALFIALYAPILTGCKQSVKHEQKKANDVSVEKSESESLYQTEGKWDNQYGDTISLSKLRGKIPVVSMVFTRCTFSCPRIVADLKAIERAVPADKKDKVVFVLISFDSNRDHTDQLKAFTKQMKLDGNWMILHGNEEDVRELSMLLNVKYKKQENGDFTHSSGFTLLDTKGAIAFHQEGLGEDPGEVIDKIRRL